MKISTAGNAGSGTPKLKTPVNVILDVPVFYDTGKGSLPVSKIYCDRLFAITILSVIESVLWEKNLALLHIGVYNPRYARNANGTPITPKRWSNHAYGLAIDFKGVITNNGNGKKIILKDFIKEYPKVYTDMVAGIRQKIAAFKQKPEIVNERDWLHIGIWHESTS